MYVIWLQLEHETKILFLKLDILVDLGIILCLNIELASVANANIKAEILKLKHKACCVRLPNLQKKVGAMATTL